VLAALPSLITSNDAGGQDIWALVFFYVNGIRAAPAEKDHLTLRWEAEDDGISRSAVRGWEADVYDEWTESERLEDDE
jgi:predicted alpha/beta hydrolase family esterase